MKKKMNNSAAKKLVPAAGMLGVSAMMLATSTYAWFTMSREVEVTGIQMTATTPENIQISLGKLSTTAGSKIGLATNNGVLVATSGTADNGNVTAPDNTTDEWWADTADISNYYQLGRIIPASSTTGLNIFYTTDAAGVGKSLKANAKYYQAAAGAAAKPDAGDGVTTNKRTTLHAFTKEHGDGDDWYGDGVNSTYKTAANAHLTKDDGYYVDIPVWLRSSSTAAMPLAVDAYVTSNSTEDNDDLYLAARAVILNDTRTVVQGDGLIEIRKDGWDGTSIVDYMNTTVANKEAVSSIASEGGAASYDMATRYDGDNDVVTVPASTGQGYGTPVQVWVRVWLEGEDPNCWNDNAGQNFNISLKFTADTITPAASIGYTALASGLVNATPTNVRFKGSGEGAAAFNSMTFTYNSDLDKWQQSGGSFLKPVNVTYKIGERTINSVADILDYLNGTTTTSTKIDDLTKANAGVDVIATGDTVSFTGTKEQAAVWVDAIPTGATTLKLGAGDAMTGDDLAAWKTALKSAIASADGTSVTVSYVAPIPTATP